MTMILNSARTAIFFCCIMGWNISAAAFGVDQTSLNAAEEARARVLFSQLRCLVCQNQSIEDSSAELAIDLRAIVREQILSGVSDQAILDFMVARYGEWVLLDPPVSQKSWLLWAFPPLIGIFGLLFAWGLIRAQSRDGAPETIRRANEITEQEQQQLNELTRRAREQK